MWTYITIYKILTKIIRIYKILIIIISDLIILNIKYINYNNSFKIIYISLWWIWLWSNL